MAEQRLRGVRVLVTRAHPGELALLLAAEGATVVHSPLIAVEPPADGGAELQARLDELDTFDWLVVTSPAGAERVVDAVAAAPDLRIGAVGTATARVVRDATGRQVLTPHASARRGPRRRSGHCGPAHRRNDSSSLSPSRRPT